MSSCTDDPALTAWTGVYKDSYGDYHPVIWFEYDGVRFTPCYSRLTDKEWGKPKARDVVAQLTAAIQTDLEAFEKYIHEDHMKTHALDGVCVLLRPINHGVQ